MKTKKKSTYAHHVSGTAVLGERGQVVIPIEAREKLKLKAGDSFIVMAHNDAIVFLPKKKMEDFVRHITAKLNI